MTKNKRVIKSFGKEWQRFDQSKLDKLELKKIFKDYFKIFPWKLINKKSIGFDMGCGSGRWALLVAPKVGKLTCIDPSSDAIAVAKQNLSHLSNIFISNHLVSYPCPKSINVYWNTGILSGSVVYIQVITGTLTGLHYTPDIYAAYYSVMHIYREVYFGSLYRYVHSSVASLVFTTVFIHVSRGIFHGSYAYVYSVTWTGIAVYIILMAIAFMGYVLPWGQMSYWGATVITNLLSSVPGLVYWLGGGLYISSPTVSRYFIIHSILPACVTGFLVFHVLYLHRLSSSSNTGYGTNNRIHFNTWLVHKDILALVSGLVVIITHRDTKRLPGTQ